METKACNPEMSFGCSNEGDLQVRLSGDWRIGLELPSSERLRGEMETGLHVRSVAFETQGLSGWDSSLLIFLVGVKRICAEKGVKLDLEGLPDGVNRLMKLAATVPEREGARKKPRKEAFLDLIGTKIIFFWRSTMEMVDFLGEASVAFGRLLTGRASFRRSDLVLLLQECGAKAFPLVSLISVLVGLILAFIGAIQLKMFGAQIFVADVVGIAMVRIMGAIMTGIIMAGRTGASFAAQIGTMQVNEEIDALQTLGISPDGVPGPSANGRPHRDDAAALPLCRPDGDRWRDRGRTGMLDLSLTEYLNRTREAVTLTYLWIGLFHSAVFGVLVAMAGCLRGMQCGRSASAVGEATTSAVVTSIVAIVVATAVITFACQILDI